MLLDIRDPLIQLETLLICSNNSKVLELGWIKQNSSNRLRQCGTALAGWAHSLLAIDGDAQLSEHVALEGSFQEDIGVVAAIFGSTKYWWAVVNDQNELDKHLFQPAKHLLRFHISMHKPIREIFQKDFDFEPPIMQHAEVLLISKINAMLRKIQKDDRYKYLSIKRSMSSDEFDHYIKINVKKQLRLVHCTFGSAAFADMIRHPGTQVLDRFAELILESMLPKGPKFSLPTLPRHDSAQPDDIKDLVYQFLCQNFSGTNDIFKTFIEIKRQGDGGVCFELKESAHPLLSLSQESKVFLVSHIIGWSADGVVLRQLLDYFGLRSFLQKEILSRGSSISVISEWLLLKENCLESVDIIDKIIYLDLLKKGLFVLVWQYSDIFFFNDIIFKVIGCSPVGRAGLAFDKYKRPDAALMLPSWRISRDSIIKMEKFTASWTIEQQASFVVRLTLEHCYDAAAYFLKRRIEEKRMTPANFDRFLLGAELNNMAVSNSLFLLFVHVLNVCGELYRPSQELMARLWQHWSMKICRLATYSPDLQALLLTHFDEKWLSWPDQIENDPALQQNHVNFNRLQTVREEVPKLRALMILALGVQKLMAGDHQAAIGYLKTAYAHQPEFFLLQMQLLLENLQLYAFETGQKVVIVEYLTTLFDGINGNPDNSALLDSLIESIEDKLPKRQPEVGSGLAPR